MTANAMMGDKDICINAGMNGYLAKPIDMGELWKALKKWIKPKEEITEFLEIIDENNQKNHEFPKEVEGLELGVALKRVMNDEKLYLRIMKKFIEIQSQTHRDIKRCLLEGKLEEAQRLSHTIKGLLGSIGAKKLQIMAEKLENEFKKKSSYEELEKLVSEFTVEYEKQMVIIKVKFEKLLRKIYYLLKQDNPESAIIFEENAFMFRKRFPFRIEKISQAFKNFDLEEVLEEFQRILKEEGIEV